MKYFLIFIAGTLGGLAILALVSWFPRHLEREEAIWQAEWLQLSERLSPPVEPRLGPSKLQLTFEALVALCLGIVVAASFAGGAGWSLQVGFSILFGWSLIALAMIDARIRLLPDKIIFPMLWLGLLIQTVPDPANIGLERAACAACAFVSWKLSPVP
jgi:prepilin signal peptidase PulO-like enzyme (type II secretory pathway)